MKTPWHVWVVGVLVVLWNLGGAYDYLMSVTRNPDYFNMMPEASRPHVLAHLDAMPVWATSVWAIGVWSALLGAVLILFRSRLSVPASALGLAGLVLGSVYSFALAPASMVNELSLGVALFNLALYVVLIATLIYARRMTSAGIFR